jgi:hypothetical protein
LWGDVLTDRRADHLGPHRLAVDLADRLAFDVAVDLTDRLTVGFADHLRPHGLADHLRPDQFAFVWRTEPAQARYLRSGRS